MAAGYSYSNYQVKRPQENYRQRLSNYQYNVMARNASAMSVRNQTRYNTQGENQYMRTAGATTGNIYSAAKWRGGARAQGLTQLGRYDPYALQQRKADEARYKPPQSEYWSNRLMQRIGGDKTAYDRMGNAMGWQWDNWMQKEYEDAISKMGPIKNMYSDNALRGMISTRRYENLLNDWRQGQFNPMDSRNRLDMPLY